MLCGTQPDPAPFVGLSERTWQHIHRLCRAHALSGVLGELILSLPRESLPPREICIQLFTELEMTKQGNQQLLRGLAVIQRKYARVGLESILLKGLTLARFYPQPELRAGGDLDLLYYSVTDYQWANVFLAQEGYKLHEDSEARWGHSAFSRRGVVVENHARAVFFDLKRHNRYFEQRLQEAILSDSLVAVELAEGLVVRTLPAELNAVYIFIHIFFHWLHWGVGFRQYSDWLLFLQAHRGQLRSSEVTTMARELDILYPMQLFAQAAIEHLGAAPDLFPFPLLEQSDSHSTEILIDVLRGGNFGFSQRPKPSKNPLVSNWRKLLFKARRSYRLHSIAPLHASRIIWGSILGHLMLHLRPRG